jgi:dedicator of cytokinesis protein 3
MTHPFALISQLPPPSLSERQHHATEDGLAHSGTLNCGLAESAVVILSLILATPRANLLRYLLEVLDIEGAESCAAVLKATYDFSASVISWKAFPSQWLTLSLMAFSSVIKFVDAAAEVMDREVFIPPVKNTEAFDEQLWMKCFNLLCDLCGSQELALEDQTHQRRRAGWIIAGDLRDDGAGLLLRLWNAMGWPVADVNQKSAVRNLRYGGVSTRQPLKFLQWRLAHADSALVSDAIRQSSGTHTRPLHVEP